MLYEDEEVSLCGLTSNFDQCLNRALLSLMLMRLLDLYSREMILLGVEMLVGIFFIIFPCMLLTCKLIRGVAVLNNFHLHMLIVTVLVVTPTIDCFNEIKIIRLLYLFIGSVVYLSSDRSCIIQLKFGVQCFVIFMMIVFYVVHRTLSGGNCTNLEEG